MSFLVRVLLPDSPGSLGQLAETFGLVDANIQSVDVVGTLPDGTVIDDIVVTLPAGALPDSLISAAQEIDGVEVMSLRPFSGTGARHGQMKMLAALATRTAGRKAAISDMLKVIPQAMAVGWCLVMENQDGLHRYAASSGAPEDDGSTPQIIIESARHLDPISESWIPESWGMLESSLAATPLTGTNLFLVIGRPGGPDFIDSEVAHLGHMGDIIGRLLG